MACPCFQGFIKKPSDVVSEHDVTGNNPMTYSVTIKIISCISFNSMDILNKSSIPIKFYMCCH